MLSSIRCSNHQSKPSAKLSGLKTINISKGNSKKSCMYFHHGSHEGYRAPHSSQCPNPTRVDTSLAAQASGHHWSHRGMRMQLAPTAQACLQNCSHPGTRMQLTPPAKHVHSTAQTQVWTQFHPTTELALMLKWLKNRGGPNSDPPQSSALLLKQLKNRGGPNSNPPQSLVPMPKKLKNRGGPISNPPQSLALMPKKLKNRGGPILTHHSAWP